MNTTINGSNNCNPLNSTTTVIGKTVLYCIIVVVSLVGNCFIGIIFYRTQVMRTPVNFYIVNMAMSDLLYPIFFIPGAITAIHTEAWLIGGPIGEASCKIFAGFIAAVSSAVSIQSLVLITADRFRAVMFPLRSPLINSKQCPYVILATWVVAIAFSWPFLFAQELVKYRGKLMCLSRWEGIFEDSSTVKIYIVSLFTVLFYIPFILLALMYSAILFKLKSQKIPGEQSDSGAEEKRAKINRKVLKMAIAIVLVFIICWLPGSIITLLVLLAWDRPPCSISRYSFLAYFVSHANCAINPCVCFLFCGNYRQGLKRLLNKFT